MPLGAGMRTDEGYHAREVCSVVERGHPMGPNHVPPATAVTLTSA